MREGDKDRVILRKLMRVIGENFFCVNWWSSNKGGANMSNFSNIYVSKVHCSLICVGECGKQCSVILFPNVMDILMREVVK